MMLYLTPAMAGALDGLLSLAEGVREHLDGDQIALSHELDRARRAAPPPGSTPGSSTR
jgi:hypothetical protein